MGKQQTQQVTLLSDSSIGSILQGIRDPFSNQVERSKIQGIINYAKEAALAKQIIAKDTRLQQCTETSISNAFMNISFVGLSLNPIKQHATFIARWNDKIRRYEASLSIMYRGLMWSAGQAGVKDIDVDVVYSADRFKIVKTGEGSSFEHEIAHAVPRDDPHQPGTELIANKFQGVYVAAMMPGSKIRKVEWIPAEHIYTVRSKSESYIDRETGKPHPKSPWVWSFDEMAKKVGIKIAQKRWEEAVIENDEWNRFRTAVALDNAAEGVIPARASDIPGTAEHVQTSHDKEKGAPAKLSIAQLTEIEKLVEQVAPNTDLLPGNVSAYMAKVARTYRANSLDQVDATKFDEIKTRIEDAIKKVQAKKAADPKVGTQKAGEGQGNAGKQQDGPAKDAGKKGGAAKAGAGKPAANAGRSAEREPGSDDDRGSDPDDSTHNPGPDNGGDPGPTDPHQG